MPTATITEDGSDERIVVPLTERGAENPFSTGSRGYQASSKVQLHNGKRYQLNFMLVEIGSKPK